MSLTLHTTLGDILIELSLLTPVLSSNFMALAASGAYDGSLFHRVVSGFMAQGGAPCGSGGKGGEAAIGGLLADEFAPTLRHTGRGTLSMATSARDSNGAQFFIAFAAAPHLDGASCVIGAVIGGGAALNALEAIKVEGKKFKPSPPETAVITSVTIHANLFAEKDAAAAIAAAANE